MADLSIVAIIPLYNGARWIVETLESVLAQTLPPDEIIVVDDGSTDDGPAIVRQFACECALRGTTIALLHKTNGGQSSARNYGVSQSKSALIALLDQDDEWYPNHLAGLVKPYKEERNRPLALTYSHFSHVDENGLIVRRTFLDSWSPRKTLAECVSGDMLIQPSATLISREAFDRVGGFDEALSCYEDDDLFRRFFIAGYDMAFVNEICSFWRIHSRSCMHSDNMWRSIRIYMAKQLREHPEHRDIIVRRFFSNAIHLRMRSLKGGAPLHQSTAFMRELRPLLPWKYRLLVAGSNLPPWLLRGVHFLRPRTRINQLRYRLRLRTRVKAALQRLAPRPITSPSATDQPSG